MYARVWVQRTNIPTAKSVVTGMSSGNKGYIVFRRSSTASNSNTLYEYDPILNSWTAKSSFPRAERNNGFSFSIGNRVYAGGGYDGTTTYFDFAEYVPSVDDWVIRANYLGYATRGVKGVSLNGKGYVVCGTLNSSTPYSNQMWEYDPNTDT